MILGKEWGGKVGCQNEKKLEGGKMVWRKGKIDVINE